MNNNPTLFNTIIDNIEFKMIRKDNKCWIKAVPIDRISKPSSIHFILDNEYYYWDIYDENGREAHEIYYEGYKSDPSFYLKSGKNCYKIDFKCDGIKVLKIKKNHKQDVYIKENCNCKSSQSNCWAKAVYYTSRPDKPPFDEM